MDLQDKMFAEVEALRSSGMTIQDSYIAEFSKGLPIAIPIVFPNVIRSGLKSLLKYFH